MSASLAVEGGRYKVGLNENIKRQALGAKPAPVPAVADPVSLEPLVLPLRCQTEPITAFPPGPGAVADSHPLTVSTEVL